MDTTLALSAFIAGMLMVLAPCTLPIIPAYVGYFGVRQSGEESSKRRWYVFFQALLFVAGFSILFILLGTGFSYLGGFVGANRLWIKRVAGIFIVISGLVAVGVLRVPILGRGLRFLKIPSVLFRYPTLSSFLLGASFGVGWTPCVGPILASILFVATVAGQVGQGALLLGIFSLGLAIPFLIITLVAEKILGWLRDYPWVTHTVSLCGGFLLVVLGVLIFTDRFVLLIGWGYRLFRFIEYERLLDFL